MKSCKAEGCGSIHQPYYGYEDSDWERCAEHKLDDMIRLDPQCVVEKCQQLPEHGVEGEVPRYCELHKRETDVQSKACLAAGCNGTRLYGYMDGVNQFCEAHRLKDMLPLMHGLPDDDEEAPKETEQESVDRASVMILEAADNEGQGVQTDKGEEDENVPLPENDAEGGVKEEYLLCHIEGCPRAAQFEMGGKMVCSMHEEEGILLVSASSHQGCMFDGCTRPSSFGFVRGDPHLCLLHKMKGMVFTKGATSSYDDTVRVRVRVHQNQKNGRKVSQCETSGCGSNAYYGTGPIATHCMTHKTYNMRFFAKQKLCLAEECEKYADFGMPNERAQFCETHASEGMEVTSHLQWKQTRQKKCATKDCVSRALYGLPNGFREYCAEHKTDEMVSTPRKKNSKIFCTIEGCTNGASYAYTENPSALFCHVHKRDGMLFHGNKGPKPPSIVCEHGGCDQKATFGYVGMKVQFCHEHALPSMEYLAKIRKGKRDLCASPGCTSRAIYGIDGKLSDFCMKHGKPASSRTCAHAGCDGARIFGFPDKPTGLRYCPLHKEDGMVAGKNMCKHPEGCERTATWGYQEAPKLRCPYHKIAGMVVCKGKTKKIRFCRATGCTVTGSYGFDENPRTFCAKHKQEGMIHHSTREVCESEGCMRRRYYGFNGEPRRFCSIHKLDGMESRKNRKLCENPGCPKQPRYGFKGKKRRFCMKHKHNGMTSISKCEIEICEKTPHFGEPGQSKRNRCYDHKDDGMVYHPKPGVPGGAAVRRTKSTSTTRARGIVGQKTILYSRRPTVPNIPEPMPPDNKDLVTWRQLAMCQPGIANSHYSMQQRSQLAQQLQQQNAAMQGQHYLF